MAKVANSAWARAATAASFVAVEALTISNETIRSGADPARVLPTLRRALTRINETLDGLRRSDDDRSGTTASRIETQAGQVEAMIGWLEGTVDAAAHIEMLHASR